MGCLFGKFVQVSCRLGCLQTIQRVSKPFSQLSNRSVQFINGTTLLCITESGPTSSKLVDRFINRWPVYKLVKFAIGSQQRHHILPRRNHPRRPSCDGSLENDDKTSLVCRRCHRWRKPHWTQKMVRFLSGERTGLWLSPKPFETNLVV